MGIGALLSLPHMEALALLGLLGVATVAAWTSARLWQRHAMLEADFLDLWDEVQRLRVDSESSVRREPQRLERAALPVFEPLYSPEEPLPLFNPDVGSRWDDAPPPTLDVGALAQRLGAQSPEAIEQLLSGQLSLAAAARQMGAGRQEARLLRWLHGPGRADGTGG